MVRLKEKLKNKLAVMKAMLDAAKAAGRNFTADEETIYAAHEVELATIQAAIAEEDKAFARQSAIETALNASAGSVANRNATPNLEVILAEGDRPWKSFGEQMQSVRAAAVPGVSPDQRLLKNAATGANESIDSDGGFLVYTDFSTELLKRTYDTGVLSPKVKRVPMSNPNANGIKINAIDEKSRVNGSRWGGIQAFWANEADTVTATKPKFRQIKLELRKLFGLCYATDEMLQDAAALEMILMDGFSEEFGFKIDDAIINGQGTDQPLGIMGSPALLTINKEAGQANGTILAENIMKMWARLYGKSRLNAAWYINQDVEVQLMSMVIAVGTAGIPIYMPAGGLSGNPYSTLFGKPIIPLEQCQTLGTPGDIIFGDFSQYAMIDKGAINAASSIHVRFVNDEQVFRFTYRVDGQPTWNSPLTPFKGTASQSPFIVLQQR
jgi:HK97 family phage major capsid protein